MSATLAAIAQLRHLYAQMLSGHVTDCAEAARGLLGPAIERMEIERNDTGLDAAAERAAAVRYLRRGDAFAFLADRFERGEHVEWCAAFPDTGPKGGEI